LARRPTSVADVYALVCVVVETLTGQVLFDGSTPAVVMRQHLIIGPELPAEWPQDVPEGVTEVLRRGLATDPAERIRSVGELVAGLEALRAAPRPAVSAPAPASTPAPQPPAPRRSSKGLLAGGVIALVGGAVVLVVIVGTILYFALQPGPSPTSEPVLAKTEEVAKNEPTEEVPSEPRETITVVETVEVEKIVTVEVEKIVTVEVEAEVAEVAPVGEVIQATPGEAVDLVLLPKFLGILVFDQVNDGAREAAAELQNPSELQFLGPTPENSVAGQIDIVTTVATQGMDGIMISNNASDQLVPAVQAAKDAGMTVVTWDSPIPSAEGEDVFIAQVDFDQTGQVMADMALSILGDEGGQFAVLSASPDASNQNAWIAAMEVALEDSKYANLELVDIVYGNDQSDESYNQALALVDKYPDMELIMAPTTVGITAAAKAMQDEGLCNTVKVSGLGLPAEMVSYTLNGCAPEFALWSFVDMGYLTYYTTYLLATGQMQAAEGVTFEAGRMGIYTIEKDPTRDVGLRVLMGPWTVYTADNVEAAAE
jgi:rhamnose transport system substrate-binding protein